MKRVHIFISGRVQGVFFRAYTQDQAKRLNLYGWVRNTQDGRVEAVFEGGKKQLEEIIKWCRQGSPQSKVASVEVFWEEPEELKEFELKY
jgi:acylphosphatase